MFAENLDKKTSFLVFFFRLFVPLLKRTDAGLYRCIARNRMGAVLDHRTEVQVACE